MPKLGVDRVHRREHVHVRRLEIFIALLFQLRVTLLDRRRDLAVDVDHVETLLDARRNLDGLDRLLAGCERRSGQAKTCKSQNKLSHDHPYRPSPLLTARK